jgi:CheY-like chemotaxis protein
VRSAVGVGSTFTVTLPLQYGASQLTTRRASPAREKPAAQPTSDKMVVAIDDDPDVIYLLRENLAEAGYRVVGAASGEEGVRLARVLRPSAITLDILMPHKDGWQILHELKADTATRDIPVIVLSIVDNKDLGYRLGAFDYLLKTLRPRGHPGRAGTHFPAPGPPVGGGRRPPGGGLGPPGP